MSLASAQSEEASLPSGAPATYSVRTEATGIQPVVVDDAFLFPFVDAAIPHTIGTLESLPDATGFAAVLDPGTAVNGLPALVGAVGGPPVPSYPGTATSRLGQDEYAEAAGAPGNTAGAAGATSYSDLVRTEQYASVANLALPDRSAPVLGAQSAAAETEAFFDDDGTLHGRAVSEVGGLGVPGVLELGAVRSTVRIEQTPGEEPQVTRGFDVAGLRVAGTPVELGDSGLVVGDQVTPLLEGLGQELGDALGEEVDFRVIEGTTTEFDDGTVVATADGLLVTVRVPGTTQSATLLLGAASVSMQSGARVIPEGPLSGPVPEIDSATAPPQVTPVPGVSAPAPTGSTDPVAAPSTELSPEPVAARDGLGLLDGDNRWLIWLYLTWLALSAALVTQATRMLAASEASSPRPDILD